MPTMDAELKQDMIAMGSNDGVPGPFLRSVVGGVATEAYRSKFSIRKRDEDHTENDTELVREMIAMGSHEGKQGPFIPLRNSTESACAVARFKFSTRHIAKPRHSVTRHGGPGSLIRVAAAFKVSSPLPGRGNRRGSLARTSSNGAISLASSSEASTMRAVSGTLEEILAAAKKGGKRSTDNWETDVVASHEDIAALHGAHGSDLSKGVETAQSYLPFDAQMESFEGHFVNLALPRDRAPRRPGTVERSSII